MLNTAFKKRKITALVVIGLLMLLMYGTNLTERQAFKNISSTFTEVYNDRLVVEGYIFRISENLFRIQKLVDHCDNNYDYSKVVNEIAEKEKAIMEIVSNFEKTKLTENEAQYLTDFKAIIENDLQIKNYSLLYSDSSGVNLSQVQLYDKKISKAQQDLDNLSKIQLEEGEKLINKANIIINRSQIWSQFEVALLIILALALYLLLFRNNMTFQK
ncbi:MCP four helix bundle domain-containing protein [Algoriphagus antarcticus]|uniref:Chemoreceptor-like protein with four helix bundle sensory module n=1 Tax=Algoriphagus antarcticus TaxID=238540 RepID=A0A3E0DNV3_9BACT|nr:MCP four helix bundle domain-containing protein [Algoriphagus antarcticus]REG84516.1 chemoreceptor-like protein with four helix bundle sensory module [Algoriphagus antarcticus]